MTTADIWPGDFLAKRYYGAIVIAAHSSDAWPDCVDVTDIAPSQLWGVRRSVESLIADSTSPPILLRCE